MTTTTSSFSPTSGGVTAGARSRHYFLSVLRRNLGLTVFCFVFEFIFFPLQYILTAAGMRARGGETNLPFFEGTGGIFTSEELQVLFTLALMALPILYTLIQYSFLHRRQSTDLFHALPIDRRRVMLINYGASALMILGPALINFIITITAAFAFGSTEFSFLEALTLLPVNAVCVLAILSITTLACVLSGTLFDSGIYALGLTFFLPVVLYLGYTELESLHGFAAMSDMDALILFSPALTPLYQVVNLRRSHYWNDRASFEAGFFRFTTALVIWLLLAAVLLLLALRCYRRRKSELAGKTGSNNAMTLLLKCSAAFAGGLLFSWMLKTTSYSDSVALSLIGCVCGGVLIYALLECIMSRGVRTLRRALPMMAVGAMLPTLLTAIILTGGFGFETRLPDVQKVDQVEVTYLDRYGFTRYDTNTIRDLQKEYEKKGSVPFRSSIAYYQDTVTLTQKDAIQAVRTLHEQFVTHPDAKEGGKWMGLTVTYTMTDGSTMRRQYYGLQPEEMVDLYDSLNASEEVKRQTHPIFALDAKDVSSVTLMNRLKSGITPARLTEDQTQDLIEVLRTDMLAETYEQMNHAAPLGYLCLTPRFSFDYENFGIRQTAILQTPLPNGDIAYDDCYVLITDAYRNTIDLLTSYGYADFAEIDWSDFTYAQATMEIRRSNDSSLLVDGPMNFEGFRYVTTESTVVEEGTVYGEDDEGTVFTGDELRILGESAVCVEKFACTPLDTGETDWWFDGENAIIYVTFYTEDQSNISDSIPVNPKKLPEEILRRFHDEWLADYSYRNDTEGEEAFEALVEAILNS